MYEKFFLTWNDFPTTVTSSFSKLRNQTTFTDVTLVCEDKTQISAHKVILSACSGFFSNILQQDTQLHLMVCLDGISTNDITNVLDYIYFGEVEIFQDNLDRFLDIAKKLELDGLLTTEKKDFEPSIDEKFNNSEPYYGDHETTATVSSTKGRRTKIKIDTEVFSTIEELNSQILQHLVKTEDGHKCDICNYTRKDVSHVKEHIESHFKGLSFSCEFCGNNFNSRTSIRSHAKRCENRIISSKNESPQIRQKNKHKYIL